MSALENIQVELAEIRQNFTDQADALAAINAKIAALEARVAGGLSAEEATAVVAELQEIKTSSQAIEDSMRAAGTTA